ncbi:MAG: serine/threonine protein kinase [Bacillus sp. (in: firmicutes)]
MFFRDFGERKYHQLFHSAIEEMGPFEVARLLGGGSYGFAYLIRNRETDDCFVLKRLRKKHAKNEKVQRNFQKEIAILQMKLHPNIPDVIQVGEAAGIPYYTMEYIDGKTFEQLIFKEDCSFTIEQALCIVGELLEITMAIHSQGIVHRDLRIPNILLRGKELYVIDFGLACDQDLHIDNKKVKNPKRAASYISDLYNIGHFLLFLLYSSYTPVRKREASWQEELHLPVQLRNYIEKLLLLQPAFPSTAAAYNALSLLKNEYRISL